VINLDKFLNVFNLFYDVIISMLIKLKVYIY